MDILGTLQKLAMESGFAAFFVTDGGWKNLIMIIFAFVLEIIIINIMIKQNSSLGITSV